MNYSAEQVRQAYWDAYESEPIIVRSPGRINLIGEHVDYNQGLVLPAAIDKEIFLAIGFAEEKSVATIQALNYQSTFEINPAYPARVGEPYWANYLLGVLNQFKVKGYQVKPFNCVLGGNIPAGAGLSSSAALECGFAFAINELHQFEVPKAELIAMALWSEHNYVGVKCGIMDQFTSMMGKKDNVILLDCRSLDYEYHAVDFPGYSFVLIDSNVKHSLASSEYNVRREECEAGVSRLSELFDGVRSLRDVTHTMMKRGRSSLNSKIYDRCAFVVEEIERVRESVNALKSKDVNKFGSLMYASHDGLATKYEVSCTELDFLVDFARTSTGVVGSRMMGGGFGGCTINLVSNNFMDEFLQRAMDAYRKSFRTEPSSIKVKLMDGTSVV